MRAARSVPLEAEDVAAWFTPDEGNAMGSTKVNARTAEAGYFGPGLFRFLKELKANNNREWFQAHKERYESEVKEPMLRFIAAFGVRLRKISRNFDADPRPIGGSMFRIYRDTRFARDKSPYKTAAAAHFQYRGGGKDVHVPGFYLHLEPGDCMGGGGLWHPDASALQKVRDRIVTRTREWKAIVDRGTLIEGDSLKRPPAGYDAAHPFIEDLKRKDIYAMTRFSDREVCAPDFLERYTEACRSAAPLVEFLTKSVGLAW
jgi:uncharacterized protein (TIGR02453 family)